MAALYMACVLRKRKTMDDLQTRCEQMCQMQQRGGRCVHIDRNTMRVLDVERWTQQMTNEIVYYMPNAAISCFACKASLSGFCIEIRNMPAAQNLRAWGWVVCMIAFAVVAIREIQRAW